jgi:hypothetical protein
MRLRGHSAVNTRVHLIVFRGRLPAIVCVSGPPTTTLIWFLVPRQWRYPASTRATVLARTTLGHLAS